MKIDGKQIAAKILLDLKTRVEKVKEKNIIPNLYIILLSDDKSSSSYVNQKIKRGGEIGVKITLDRENPQILEESLIKKIDRLNRDKSVHAIIVQRPIPPQLEDENISEAVAPEKDVDGFNHNSPFATPVATAVLKMLEIVHPENFNEWLKSQNITVIGKGITAGKPIIKLLQKMGTEPTIISSKTENRNEILKNSDIVISAVGKPDVFKADKLKENVIAIGVGMHMEKDGKFYGDFNEEEVSKVASFYSPTPGGVGPVNVAMLLGNLVTAAEQQSVIIK